MSIPLRIHYRRLPERVVIYDQHLLLDTPDVKVSFQPSTPLAGPLEVAGVPILEPGAPAVWFTFPGVWHDIGRFHTAEGRFTGVYANVLTPVEIRLGVPVEWSTTDLFLDVWCPPGGPPTLLDHDEWEQARQRGDLDDGTARRADAEARRIMADARRGSWPPPIVSEWTLTRAEQAVEGR